MQSYNYFQNASLGLKYFYSTSCSSNGGSSISHVALKDLHEDKSVWLIWIVILLGHFDINCFFTKHTLIISVHIFG